MKETEKKTPTDVAMDLFACMQTHLCGWEQMVSKMKQIENKYYRMGGHVGCLWAC